MTKVQVNSLTSQSEVNGGKSGGSFFTNNSNTLPWMTSFMTILDYLDANISLTAVRSCDITKNHHKVFCYSSFA